MLGFLFRYDDEEIPDRRSLFITLTERDYAEEEPDDTEIPDFNSNREFYDIPFRKHRGLQKPFSDSGKGEIS